MSKQELNEINEKWDWQMKNDGLGPFLTYQPFFDSYWEQPVKLVICNLETYDATGDGFQGVLDFELFSGWLKASVDTIRKSSVFAAGLLQKLDGAGSPSEIDLRSMYQNTEKLLDMTKRITYMNLRKEIGEDREEDSKRVLEFLAPHFTNRTNNQHHITNFKDMMNALEPDIFIVSGETGADIVSRIYRERMNLVYDHNGWLGNTLVCSVGHPSSSKFSYQYMQEKIAGIAQEYTSKRG